MINRQKHYTKYLHDKLEIKDIRCNIKGENEIERKGIAAIFIR